MIYLHLILLIISAVALTCFIVSATGFWFTLKERLPFILFVLFNCPQCLGIWAGIAVGTIHFYLYHDTLCYFCTPFVVSLLSALTHRLLNNDDGTCN